MCSVIVSPAQTFKLTCGKSKIAETPLSPTFTPPASVSVRIGGEDGPLASADGFIGEIDDVRLFGAALSDAQRQLFDGQLTGDEPSLLSYWRMGEEVDPDTFQVLDGTGNGRHCTHMLGYTPPFAVKSDQVFAKVPMEERRLKEPEVPCALHANGGRRQLKAAHANAPRRALQSSSSPSVKSCLEVMQGGESNSGQHLIGLNGTTYMCIATTTATVDSSSSTTGGRL